MNETTTTSAIPSAVSHKMHLVRQRKIWVQVASAAVAAIAVLLLAMGIAMLIDRLATLYDWRWRAVLTSAAIGMSALTICGWLFLAWRRGLRWERVALDVDQQLPQSEERWTTMTRLGPHATNPNVVHPAMLRKVAAEAAGLEPHVDPHQVVSMSALTRGMFGLSAVAAALVVAVALDPHRMSVLIQRFWMPGASISATELVRTSDNMVVGRGEPVDLKTGVEGTPVDRALLFMQAKDAPEQTVTLVAHNEGPLEFSHHIRAVEEPFQYRIRAGDGQTEWKTVEVTDRPEIEAIKMTITPPGYTGQAKSTIDKWQRRVSAMEKSEFELAIRPTVPVKHLQLRLQDDQLVAMTAGADGWYRWTTTLSENFSLSPILTEPRGLTNRRVSKMQVNVVPDRAPVVKVVSPDDQVAVRPNDTVDINFTAQDDVGIASAVLVVYDESDPDKGPIPLATIPIDLGDQVGQKKVDGSVQLDLSQWEAQDGAQIGFEVRVTESRDAAINAAAQASNQPNGNRMARNDRQRPANGQQQPSTQNGAATPQDTSTNNAARPQTDATASMPANQAENNADPSNATTAANAKPANAEATAQGATPANTSMANADASQTPSTSQTGNAAKPNEGAPPATSTASDSATSKQGDPSSKQGDSTAKSGDPSTKVADSTAKTGSPDAKDLAGNPANSNGGADSDSGANPSKDATSKAGAPGDSSATKMADAGGSKSAPNSSPSASPSNSSNPSEMPRTVASDRQALNPMSSPNASGNNPDASKMANNTPDSGNAGQPQNGAGQPQNGGGQPGDGKQSDGKSAPPANSMANQSQQPQSGSPGGTPPPGNDMQQRMLDVAAAQSSNSQRMQLKVDQYAGSYDGQQRHKLEIAIAPELAALDKALAAAQTTSRGVLDELENGEWRGKHDRDMTNAERATVDAQQVIRKLGQKTHNTPYAFIGLQLIDIGAAHVNPARNNFWTALQSDGAARATNVKDGWQHVTRARELLKNLNGQFQRAQKEFELADKLQQVKTMYQVFIENSFQMLGGEGGDPSRYARQMAEFKLDEEYLKRLKEVLEMRRQLEAELARILAEDPRLLQRYMDLFKNRATNLREQLANLSAEQQDLNREVRAWTLVDETERPRIAQILMQRQLADATDLAKKAGDLQDKYATWMPLSRNAKDPDLQSTSKQVQATATAANELSTKAAAIVTELQRIKPKAPAAGAAPAADANAASANQFDSQKALEQLRESADALTRNLTDLDVALLQQSSREDDAEIATFAASRLAEERRLTADTAAWIRQIEEHKAGNYSRAAEVAQYRLAETTDRVAGKLGDLEQQMAARLRRNDGKLPEAIAEKARAVLEGLDKQAQPNQMAAVYALRGNQMPRATERQQAAYDGLAAAEKAFDDMMKLAIVELDKMPVQDPIAQLLEDPTLDELLRLLEQESELAELLGLNGRPGNLQILGDWMRPGGGGMGSGRMFGNQMWQQNQRARNRIDRSLQEAMKRALKEQTERPTIEQPKPTIVVNWNKLVSELENDLQQGRDKAPPEQYRRAIEQYFGDISEISRAAAEEKEERP